MIDNFCAIPSFYYYLSSCTRLDPGKTRLCTSRSDLEKTTIFQTATVLTVYDFESKITLTSKSKPEMRQTAFLATRSAAWRRNNVARAWCSELKSSQRNVNCNGPHCTMCVRMPASKGRNWHRKQKKRVTRWNYVLFFVHHLLAIWYRIYCLGSCKSRKSYETGMGTL